MDEILRKASRAALLFLSLCIMLWALLPDWRIYTAGVSLGVAASLVNAYLLRKRVSWIGIVFKDNPDPPRRVGMGLGSRLAMVLLAAMIAYRFPETFHLPSVMYSCFFMPVVSLFVAFVDNRRQI
ncbi:ATP synthase subunit I [Paenibacillaceae bacterium WGS1546]|uniref:ATP synthase subunit I n=1 Tax=Cohnella sp. WGS1546 TaxID=3366810 RepID=UPI00372D0831